MGTQTIDRYREIPKKVRVQLSSSVLYYLLQIHRPERVKTTIQNINIRALSGCETMKSRRSLFSVSFLTVNKSFIAISIILRL